MKQLALSYRSLFRFAPAAAALLLASQVAEAKRPFNIKNRNYGNADSGSCTLGGGNAELCSVVRAQIDTLFDKIETDVNKGLLEVDDADKYMGAISNSAALSASGVGTDYATPFDVAEIGVSAGLGADLGDQSLSTDLDPAKLQGFGVQMGVLIGFNPGVVAKSKWGPIDPNRLRLYLSYFSMSDYEAEDVNINFSSFGLHAKYKLIEEKNWAGKLVKWGGVDVGTGYHYSSMKASISKAFTESDSLDVEIEGSPDSTLNATFEGDLVAGADSGIHVIPFEASSYVRLLYALSFYGGVGIDLGFGSSSAIVSDDGATFSGNDTEDGGTIGTISGDADLDLGESAGPNFMNGRYFVGAQVDAGVFNIFAQYNQSLTAGTVGFTVGSRLYW